MRIVIGVLTDGKFIDDESIQNYRLSRDHVVYEFGKVREQFYLSRYLRVTELR